MHDHTYVALEGRFLVSLADTIHANTRAGLWKFSAGCDIQDAASVVNLLAIPPIEDPAHQYGWMELLPGRLVDGSGPS